MTNEAGVWIDHKHAFIVILGHQGEETKRITSHVEKHVRYSGDAGEDIEDRRFDDHLSRYYDRVIALLHDAGAVLIMGPGEAKGELQKRLEDQEVNRPIVSIETADKMTDGQIVAEVRHHFGG